MNFLYTSKLISITLLIGIHLSKAYHSVLRLSPCLLCSQRKLAKFQSSSSFYRTNHQSIRAFTDYIYTDDKSSFLSLGTNSPGNNQEENICNRRGFFYKVTTATAMTFATSKQVCNAKDTDSLSTWPASPSPLPTQFSSALDLTTNTTNLPEVIDTSLKPTGIFLDDVVEEALKSRKRQINPLTHG